MEVDSDIHSVDIYSSESEESRLGEDDRGTGSLSAQAKGWEEVLSKSACRRYSARVSIFLRLSINTIVFRI
jgi:hypothetical protein